MSSPVAKVSTQPTGQERAVLSVTNWHRRARRNVTSRIFGGNSAAIASRARTVLALSTPG